LFKIGKDADLNVTGSVSGELVHSDY